MMLTNRVAAGVADVSIVVAYRRWGRLRVREDSTFRTTAGVVGIRRSRSSTQTTSPRPTLAPRAPTRERPSWPRCVARRATPSTASGFTGWVRTRGRRSAMRKISTAKRGKTWIGVSPASMREPRMGHGRTASFAASATDRVRPLRSCAAQRISRPSNDACARLRSSA